MGSHIFHFERLRSSSLPRMGNEVSTASGVIGAAAAVGSFALAFYPVVAVERGNGMYKVCSKFNKDDLTLPFDVCDGKSDCVYRCAFNVPESELPAIENYVKGNRGEFKKFSRFSKAAEKMLG